MRDSRISEYGPKSGQATYRAAPGSGCVNATVGCKRIAEVGEIAEAEVARANARAGVVTFARQGKEWRLSGVRVERPAERFHLPITGVEA